MHCLVDIYQYNEYLGGLGGGVPGAAAGAAFLAGKGEATFEGTSLNYTNYTPSSRCRVVQQSSKRNKV